MCDININGIYKSCANAVSHTNTIAGKGYGPNGLRLGMNLIDYFSQEKAAESVTLDCDFRGGLGSGVVTFHRDGTMNYKINKME